MCAWLPRKVAPPFRRRRHPPNEACPKFGRQPMKSCERPRTRERAGLVRPGLAAPVASEDLQEFPPLALSAGAIPVATVTGRRDRPDPRYFMGSGKAEELRGVCEVNEAEVVVVDHALSPSQERNLETS